MKRIELPWPSRDLHPNSRVHWAKKARATKAARATACLVVKSMRITAPDVPTITLWIDAYPPDRRKRDRDGLLSSLKATLDGIADGFGVDDSRFDARLNLVHSTHAHGRIVIRISP